MFTASALFLAASNAMSEERHFVLATGTSAQDSGLLNHLVARFYEQTGIRVRVVAVGTGQAFALGARGDAAALLTHDLTGELAFVADGFGRDRRPVMHNHFIIVGPRNDPAGIADTRTVQSALKRLAMREARFFSRGDDSGTHRQERRVWTALSLDPSSFGSWYREAGGAMGQTLLTAIEMDAYALSDSATWVTFNQKRDHIVLTQSDAAIVNQYASLLATHPDIPEADRAAAVEWHEWLTGTAGQAAIADFKVNGERLFSPGAPN
ncbi:MAG: substrate-binding domain-containing protein [Pseudomonadota bacterium]